ncbi:hypothetical protein QQP08_002827, partial [Theobroma cacao]
DEEDIDGIDDFAWSITHCHWGAQNRFTIPCCHHLKSTISAAKIRSSSHHLVRRNGQIETSDLTSYQSTNRRIRLNCKTGVH